MAVDRVAETVLDGVAAIARFCGSSLSRDAKR